MGTPWRENPAHGRLLCDGGRVRETGLSESACPSCRRSESIGRAAQVVANGAGITSKLALKLLHGGVDVLTTGNHVWRQKEVYSFLATDERIVRPANYPAGSPGRGLTVRPAADGGEVAIVVDLHAEATSEKVAMGHYLDGRVTAVLGTHTHVQTSDARVLPGGTAYMTDVGMTGPLESVIGVRSDIIVRRFLTELPAQFEVQFEVADGPVRLDAALVSADGGRATGILAFEVIL